MNTMTLTICGERYDNGNGDTGFHIRRYAYLGESGGHVRPADANYALKLVERLTSSDDATSWVEGEPPQTLTRLFDITVDVENHGRPNARYAVDYRKYNGCPLAAVADGMAIYAAIKKHGVRPAMQQVKDKETARQTALTERRAAAEAKARLEAQTPRFAADAFYGYTTSDGFGHIVGQMLRIMSVGANRGAARVRSATGEKTVRIRDYGNGQGEYFTLGNAIVRASDRIVKDAGRA